MIVNAYDFDETIYDGDSSVDFFKYAIKQKKRIILNFFVIGFAGAMYLLKLREKEYFKTVFFSFVRYFDDVDKLVESFWDKNDDKIKKFYLEKQKNTDYVISASPEFLLAPIAKKIGFNLIATDVEKKTGKLKSKNCYGEEKVRRFKKTNNTVKEFYTDSLSDEPMCKIAQEAFIVDDKKIIPWSEYKRSNVKRIKSFLFNRDFIVFVAIGLINAINGVWLALLYRNFIAIEFFSYSLGFLTSVIVAYILNSIFNFHKKLSMVDCVKYIVGNIPNYIIQICTVCLLIGVWGWDRLLTYVLAAAVSVPLTFCLVKIGVYNK